MDDLPFAIQYSDYCGLVLNQTHMFSVETKQCYPDEERTEWYSQEMDNPLFALQQSEVYTTMGPFLWSKWSFAVFEKHRTVRVSFYRDSIVISWWRANGAFFGKSISSVMISKYGWSSFALKITWNTCIHRCVLLEKLLFYGYPAVLSWRRCFQFQFLDRTITSMVWVFPWWPPFWTSTGLKHV